MKRSLILAGAATSLMASAAFPMPAIAYSPDILPGFHANTLTRLMPDLYAALNYISRELVGALPGVNRNTGAERGAVGQFLVWPVAPVAEGGDVTPAMQVPEPPDQIIGNRGITLTKSKFKAFGWTGEEQRGLNTGPGYLTIQQQQIAQALRALVNEVEADVFNGLAQSASRAWGTPGTVPFTETDNVAATAQARKILADNGADPSAWSFVTNTSAGANLRNLKNLTRVNEAGSTMGLRDGELLNINGFSIRESNAAQQFIKGTAASATTTAAALAVGATSIPIAAAGTGTIKAGDVVNFAGDPNKYVVRTGLASAAAGGTITINNPGLRQAKAASAVAITLENNFLPSVAYAQSAFGVAMRPPARPLEGDLASDVFLITDARSGMTFEVSIYPGYRKVRYEVALAWGWAPINDEGIALVLG